MSEYGIVHKCESSNEEVFNSLEDCLNKFKFTWAEFSVGAKSEENSNQV